MADLPRPEFWDWFVDLDVAREVRKREAPHADVMAVALRRTDARAMIVDAGGPDQPYFALLNREQPLDADLLGYEVVGAEWTLDFHSWHCHDYAGDARDQLGINVDGQGLLTSYEDAKRVLDWMLAQPPEHSPAPVPWVVVGLARAEAT